MARSDARAFKKFLFLTGVEQPQAKVNPKALPESHTTPVTAVLYSAKYPPARLTIGEHQLSPVRQNEALSFEQ